MGKIDIELIEGMSLNKNFFEELKKNKYKEVVFLSERFLKVYEILKEQNPEIALPNYRLRGEYELYDRNTIFVNDINMDIDKIDIVSNMVFCIKTTNMYLPIMEKIDTINDEKIDNLKNITTFCLDGKGLINFATYNTKFKFLQKELELIRDYDKTDGVRFTDYAPNDLKEYIKFIYKYEIQIRNYYEMKKNRRVYTQDDGTDAEKFLETLREAKRFTQNQEYFDKLDSIIMSVELGKIENKEESMVKLEKLEDLVLKKYLENFSLLDFPFSDEDVTKENKSENLGEYENTVPGSRKR